MGLRSPPPGPAAAASPDEAHPWWRFLPGSGDAVEAGDIAKAASEGKGALARALRAALAELGAGRTARRLRAAETMAGRRFGVPFRLLLATSVQARSLEDALAVAFAIAGFALESRAIEGIGALRAALGDREGAVLCELAGELDGVLVTMPERDGRDAGHRALLSLAETVAIRCRAPVALACFTGSIGAEETAAPGVTLLDDALGGASAFDERFGATFGTILSKDAAQGLCESAAGWAARQEGVAPKLLITDLDGTLWNGVLGEGGGEIEGEGMQARVAGEGAGDASVARTPDLHEAYAQALARLAKRGLILAVASRNERSDVARAFEHAEGWPLSLSAFSAIAVGWTDKGQLVADVLERLSLAPEHAVLVDDDPVNCAKVAARFPQMDVRLFGGDASRFAAGLLADPLLGGRLTGADSGGGEDRAALYARRAGALGLRAETPDIAAFLSALRTEVTLVPLGPALVPRAAELGARVNQFRLTALTPNALELGARTGGLDLMARLDDAFGAHGLVGLLLATTEGEAAVIDNLLLSCRALERGVEGVMLRGLALRARARGLARLVGRVERLARNEPARDCLSRHGFVDAGGAFVFDLRVERADGLLAAPPEGVTMRFEPEDAGAAR